MVETRYFSTYTPKTASYIIGVREFSTREVLYKRLSKEYMKLNRTICMHDSEELRVFDDFCLKYLKGVNQQSLKDRNNDRDF